MPLDGEQRPVTARLASLCEQSAQATAVDGGSVALVSTQTTRVVVSATDEVAVALEETQAALGEGPYLDAVTAVGPVLVPDLGDTQSSRAQRWPVFAKEAKALDVSAMFAFPIRVSRVSVGTFGLYRREPGELSMRGLGMALTAVEGIAEALLDHQVWTDLPPTKPWPAPALTPLLKNTAMVHQAAGMVMVQLDGTIDEAMALLRATAFSESTPMGELAREVVGRRRRFQRGDPR